MPSKFFTNQNNNTLENRLTDILKNYDIKSIEFLLGYFRISGFKKISKYLSSIEKTRILVGINIDKLTLDAKERGRTLNTNDKSNFTDEFIAEQEDILKNSNYSKEVDESMQILSEMLINSKLEIKISREKNIHAKVYIFREKDISRHDGTAEFRGSIITGSSNLSENGLTKNYEFNVELKDSDDIEFGLKEFDKLWADAVEISQDDIDEIKDKTYLKEVTPYELYLKFLIEHFENRVEYDPSVANDLPTGFMKLAYQIDAVNDGLDKINKHGGFFLSDVVGLGKTVTATMIVRRLLESTKGKVLIIAPPSIKDEWEETFSQFKIGNMRGYKFVSNGSLNKMKNIEVYETIIIDESHKFKNWSTNRYKEIEIITKESSLYNKKVILVSATPLNNKPEDIANQLYLFQDSRNSTIDSFPNLKEFFADIDERFKKIIKRQPQINSLDPNFINVELTPTEKADLESLSKELGSKILREVMVRRTRTDIQTNKKYKEDIESQGLTIPKSKPVEMIEYKLDDKTLIIFNRTIDILSKELNDPIGNRQSSTVREIQSDIKNYYICDNNADKDTIKESIRENLDKLISNKLSDKIKVNQKKFDDNYDLFRTDKKKIKELDALKTDIDLFNKIINDFKNNDYTTTELFFYKIYFADVLDNGGFDVVIANPPYVRQEKIQDLKAKKEIQDFKSYTGTADLYIYFFEKGFNLLKKDGVLTYITSNKWTRAKYGAKFREFVLDNAKLLDYIDFNGVKVFESATVDTSVMIFKKSKINDTEFQYCLVDSSYNKNVNLENYIRAPLKTTQ